MKGVELLVVQGTVPVCSTLCLFSSTVQLFQQHISRNVMEVSRYCRLAGDFSIFRWLGRTVHSVQRLVTAEDSIVARNH
jgi:hypothetical protein